MDLSLPFEEQLAIGERTRQELGITDELLRRAKQARLIAGWGAFATVVAVAYAMYRTLGGEIAALFVITGIGPAIVGLRTHAAVSTALLRRLAPGVIEYEEAEAERIKAAQAAFERQVKASTEYWCSLKGHEFEDALTDLLCGLGFKATTTNRSSDGGVDILVRGSHSRIAIQCKRYNKPVGVSVIRELYGTVTAGGYSLGVLAVTGGVTKGVRGFVEGRPLWILELKHIVNMQMELNAKGPHLLAGTEAESTLLRLANL